MREIGMKLKVARESQQMTLDFIAEKTKISKQHLKNIEEGFWDFLPEPYIKGIIYQYAAQVKLDGKLLYEEYQMALLQEMQQMQAVQSEKSDLLPLNESSLPEQSNENLSNRTNKSLIAVVLTLLVLVLIFFLTSKFKQDSDVVQLQSVSPTITDTTSNTDSIPPVMIISPPQPMDLEIRAIDETWLQITVDDSLVDEVTFSPRMARNWQGHKKFGIFLGNAAGVEFFLNGEKLNFKGQKGRVVSLEITKEGLVRK